MFWSLRLIGSSPALVSGLSEDTDTECGSPSLKDLEKSPTASCVVHPAMEEVKPGSSVVALFLGTAPAGF